MDDLRNILSRKNFDEPPEMVAIRKFVHDTYNENAEVLVREQDIIVSVRSAALANSLRLKINELRLAAQTEKRIVFRIR